MDLSPRGRLGGNISQQSRECADLLVGPRIQLRGIAVSDVTERYVHWMNDPEVIQYLESRFAEQSAATITRYVETMIADPDNELFAIVDQASGTHIGNIRLGPLDRHRLTAVVGLMIGDKRYQGRGFGTEAIQLVTRYAFECLGLRKLSAGAYENNRGSIRAFEKAGWTQEGIHPEAYQFETGRVGHVALGIVRPGE